MPRKDTFHEAVRDALIKQGWIITHDPYLLEYHREPLYVDLGAELPLAAEREGRKIAVEIKSFLGKSTITDLYHALGQYILYRLLLGRNEPERTLYLAMPTEAFDAVLEGAEGEALIVKENLKLLVFDVNLQVVEKWIE
ncbi:MAG TPA: element excision factor XisH family protein [Chthonomonadaceae bacterium]|nr:element excision factor XisH family protein [Chthonomonadaceae bacterium]